MNQIEKAAKLRVFREFSLQEKISVYERGELQEPTFIKVLFQELINTGDCWAGSMDDHYACYAAYYIRAGVCEESTEFPMPDEARDPTYLFGPLQIGYDVWGRAPTHEDFGRPLRWKEVRRDKIQQFKKNLALANRNVELPAEECCK